MDDEMDPEVIFDALWPELEDDPDFEAFANSPYVSGAGGGNMALRGDLDTFALHLLIDRVMDVGLRDGAPP